ncbi:MAG: class I tRNA ligase family protein, partial [Candidatus Acidiferrales bacterium]
RAFANKIWNAARFIFFNLEKSPVAGVSLEDLAGPQARAGAPYRVGAGLPLVDRWIYSRLSTVSAEIDDALANFRYHEASHLVYQFFWHEFCDWYIEWVKPALASTDRDAATAAWRNLFAIFDSALRLLHPFMPFLTEELWHKLPQRAGAKSIALEPFPAPRVEWRDAEAEREMTLLQEIIVVARNIRAEANLDAKKKSGADFSTPDPAVRRLLEMNLDPILRLAALSGLTVAAGHLDPNGGVVRSTARFDLRIPFSASLDVGAEVTKLRKERERLGKDIESKRLRLADPAFRSKAPERVVKTMESALAEREAELAKLRERLAQLQQNPATEASA